VSLLFRTAGIGTKGAAAADIIAPALVSAQIPAAGTTIEITFTEAVSIGAGGNGGFVLDTSGAAVTLTYSSGAGTGTLIYTLSRPVVEGETILDFDYTQPGNGVEDAAGNDLATFLNQQALVTNNASDETAPTLSNPVDDNAGSTDAALTVDTDEANGTLYWVISTSASAPSAAQVKAGQMHTGAAAADSGSQAVSGTGTQTITGESGLTASTTYYAHFMHEDASSNQSTVASGDGFTTDAAASYETESETLFAAMSSEPDATRKGHIDTLVAALKTAGIWTQLDMLFILAAHDSQAARLNWVNPGTDTLAVSNAPTFTTDQGYTGNGSNAALNSTTLINALTLYTQNDGHLSIWNRSTGQEDASQAGGAVTQPLIRCRNTSNQILIRVSSNTASTIANANGGGHFLANRVDSAEQSAWRNGTQISTNQAATSAARPANPFTLLNASGTFSSQQLAAASIGGGLTGTEIGDFYTALQTYMTAVGA
jgi:hypothetical protein